MVSSLQYLADLAITNADDLRQVLVAFRTTLKQAIRATAQETVADTEEWHLRLRTEQIQPYKRSVGTEEMRLRKEVVAEQQLLDVLIAREKVYIECLPGSGHVLETPIGEGKTSCAPKHKEQVQTSIQTLETGKAAIGKRQVKRLV